jgi:hypothetical protein
MPTSKPPKPSNRYCLDAARIRRVQVVLGTLSETETIDRALDFVLAKHAESESARKAHERWMKRSSGRPLNRIGTFRGMRLPKPS